MANRMAGAIAKRMAKLVAGRWQKHAPNPNPNQQQKNDGSSSFIYSLYRANGVEER